VDFIAVDTINDPGGYEQMQKLGVRHVPVVAKGTQYILCHNLELVAEFVGVHGTGHVPLPPDELVKKWINVLHATQRYVRQFSAEQLMLDAQPNRPRQTRWVAHHVFNIGDAHLKCVVDGAKDVNEITRMANVERFISGEDLARFGADVIARLESWWGELTDRSGRQTLDTVYGTITLHQLLDRSTWHSAQHARQIMDVLERLGITPDGRLTAAELAGLPLPERIWD
jgi:hypothetical protein